MTTFSHSPAFLGITSKWFNDQASSDLEVRLKNGKVLHCHRLVLRSWSEVWAAALENKKETSLDLTAHDPAIAEVCVRYCYTTTIDILNDNFLTRVHLFAHQYNLKDLATACEQRLTRLVTTELTASNCTGLYCYLLEHEFPHLPNSALLRSVKAFMCKEFVTVSKSDGFLRLPEKVLCQLLKEDGLIAPEDDVLDACCRWLAGSPKTKTAGNDQARADRVMQLVRFPMLSAKKLLEFKSHPMVSQSETLLRRHHFAMGWVMIQQVPKRDQEPLRIKLREENKTEILTPRIPPISLKIQSQILDEEMSNTLSSMFGGSRTARLLDSSSVMTSTAFERAVKGQGLFLLIIKSNTGHVFGAYVEGTFSSISPGWISASPNNFLFSLKAIAPQQVVKLKRSKEADYGISNSYGRSRKYGLQIGYESGFLSQRTSDDPAFELAPGYEAVGSKTLHGQFGDYTPVFMEVFALST